MATEKSGPDWIGSSDAAGPRAYPIGDGLDGRAVKLCDAVGERLRGLMADQPEPRHEGDRPDSDRSPMLPGLEGY